MSQFEFSEREKEIVLNKLQSYFSEELDHELGRFEAEFFLEFIDRELGAIYYNKGLFDARAIMQSKLENISEAIYEIEKPTSLR